MELCGDSMSQTKDMQESVHSMRGSLNPIVGFFNLIDEQKLTHDERELYHAARTSIKKIERELDTLRMLIIEKER